VRCFGFEEVAEVEGQSEVIASDVSYLIVICYQCFVVAMSASCIGSDYSHTL